MIKFQQKIEKIQEKKPENKDLKEIKTFFQFKKEVQINKKG